MMAPGYKMSRFDRDAIAKDQRRTPEQYVAYVGLMQARANFTALKLQSQGPITAPFWLQVDAILKREGA